MHWTPAEVDILVRLKTMHIQQQAAERENLELRMQQARDCMDNNRNPKYAFFYPDGYTEHKGLTPKEHYMRESKGGIQKHGNRLIGVKVVCGPIDTHFLYSTDDIVSGGANIMIEVMRQCFKDLSVELENINLELPKHIFLQFDNCGENKNKYMFSYLSLLVQQNFVDVFEINFLIVGHTHGHIDQFFSTVSTKLHRAKVILSSLAWRNLLNNCINTENKPLVNRKISLYYDYKKWLHPIINQKIKYFQIPHVFQLKSVCGIPVCVYKMFSTSTEWLPMEPKLTVRNTDEIINCSLPIRLEKLCIVGGEKIFIDKVVGESTANMTLAQALSTGAAKRAESCNTVLPYIINVEHKCILGATVQMDAECDFGYLQRRVSSEYSDLGNEIANGSLVFDALRVIQENIKSAGNKESGYVMWLDFTKILDINFMSTHPEPINYFRDVRLKCNNLNVFLFINIFSRKMSETRCQ